MKRPATIFLMSLFIFSALACGRPVEENYYPAAISEVTPTDGGTYQPVPQGQVGYLTTSGEVVLTDLLLPQLGEGEEVVVIGEAWGNPSPSVCTDSWSVAACGSYLLRARVLPSEGVLVVDQSGLPDGSLARFALAVLASDGSVVAYMDTTGLSGNLVEVNPDNGDNLRLGSWDGQLHPCGSGSALLQCQNLSRL